MRISVVEEITYRRYFSQSIISKLAYDALPWLKKLFYKKLVELKQLPPPTDARSSRRAWLNDSKTTQSTGGISHVTHAPADTIPYAGLYNPLDPFTPGFMPGLSVQSSPAPDPEPDRTKELESTSGGDFGGGGAGSSYDDSPGHSSHSHHTDTDSSHHDTSHSYDSSSSHSDNSSSWGDSSSSDSTSYDSGSSYDSSSSDSGSSWDD